MSEVPPLVRVTRVEVVGDHRLRLSFEDGTVGDVSYEGREWKGVLEPLSDPQVFAEVTVDEQMGTIAWPNGIDVAPEPLYVEACANRVVASR
jgi:Protein of unknown function (DUF2442)